MYTYKAKVLRVVDGDTVDFLIDLGFSTKVQERIRLEGINAPETRTRDLDEKTHGLAAKAALVARLNGLEWVTLQTKKDVRGKFGRYLGTIFIDGDKSGKININAWMVANGFAVYKEY